jgi:hypothetical protein
MLGGQFRLTRPIWSVQVMAKMGAEDASPRPPADLIGIEVEA